MVDHLVAESIWITTQSCSCFPTVGMGFEGFRVCLNLCLQFFCGTKEPFSSVILTKPGNVQQGLKDANS